MPPPKESDPELLAGNRRRVAYLSLRYYSPTGTLVHFCNVRRDLPYYRPEEPHGEKIAYLYEFYEELVQRKLRGEEPPGEDPNDRVANKAYPRLRWDGYIDVHAMPNTCNDPRQAFLFLPSDGETIPPPAESPPVRRLDRR